MQNLNIASSSNISEHFKPWLRGDLPVCLMFLLTLLIQKFCHKINSKKFIELDFSKWYYTCWWAEGNVSHNSEFSPLIWRTSQAWPAFQLLSWNRLYWFFFETRIYGKRVILAYNINDFCLIYLTEFQISKDEMMFIECLYLIIDIHIRLLVQ